MTLLPLVSIPAESSFWGFAEDATSAYNGVLWKRPVDDFSEESYDRAIRILFEEFQQTTGKNLKPQSRKRVGLKVYTNSGAGLNTPLALVQAVIRELLRNGYTRDQLFILDAREGSLREAGFLPPLSRMGMQGPYFDGVRVYALDQRDLKSPVWYYESPLPREFSSPLGRALLQMPLELDPVEARKSYLPSPLMEGVDFWINLPMAAHHPALGLSAALANASLWNISNGSRFFSSPANAPVAVAEIASIPELKASWALNLLSLEAFQYIAGPAFNANYTNQIREIWMAVDPVILDANLIHLINRAREADGFTPLPVLPEFIEYSVQLGLGQGVAEMTEFR